MAILANLVNEKYALGFVPEVTKLAADPDLTVAISATRALAKVGTAADIAPLEQAIAARIADLKGSATIPEMQRVGLVRAVEVFMQPSLEALKLRMEPIVIPTATPVVTVKAENTDLPRLMPLDNNNVYNAKGLLRAWPKDGPKELWRVEVGEGKAAVTEVGGRAFTAAQFDGKQWALCLNPATGATIWKHEIYPKAAGNTSPTGRWSPRWWTATGSTSSRRWTSTTTRSAPSTASMPRMARRSGGRTTTSTSPSPTPRR